MLRVTLLGNLGADPEVRFTAKGAQIVSFRVAVNQVRTGPDGERQENTEWFRVRVSGRQSEFVQRLSKGARVLAIGRLDIGHYQSKDGELRTSFDVWADDVQAVSRPTGMGGEPEERGVDREAETPEPVPTGVSSLSSSGASSARTSGSNGRANRTPTESTPTKAEDLEDLPF
jgi:single-strand DNA-binding protein